MKNSFVSVSMSILSLLGLSSCADTKAENIIDLRDLYKRSAQKNTPDNSGNFMQSTSGKVLFFVPFYRHALNDILQKKSPPSEFLFLVYEPSNGTSKLETLKVEEQNGRLKIAEYIIEQPELDRERLGADWAKIYRFCEEYASEVSGRKGIFGQSVVRIGKTRFLISGGESCGSVAQQDKNQPSTAIIFDVADNKVIQKIALTGSWSGHSSFLLDQQKVALVYDGMYSPPRLEIIDLPSAKSRYIQSQGEKGITYGTMCLDQSRDNCFLVAGGSAYPGSLLVRKISLRDGRVTVVRELKCPRSYGQRSEFDYVSVNAILVSKDKLLVSGGSSSPNQTYGVIWRKEAEIIHLDADN